ncbi:MAG: hypothetical protein IKS37_10260 [Solobacterium sp.]|nr:hypothetical protein [Solobacterium sp.]
MTVGFIDEMMRGILSSKDVLNASCGEVTRIRTINPRSHRPERDGLYDERIFGPVNDWTCFCGVYNNAPEHEGAICRHCGVPVLPSSVRRTRIGHITLAEPVIPVCYLHEKPSRLSLLLNIDPTVLKDFACYQYWLVLEKGDLGLEPGLYAYDHHFNNPLFCSDYTQGRIISGGRAIQLMLTRLFSTKDAQGIENPDGKTNLQIEFEKLCAQYSEDDEARYRVLSQFVHGEIDPQHLLITILPVIPPVYRPENSKLGKSYFPVLCHNRNVLKDKRLHHREVRREISEMSRLQGSVNHLINMLSEVHVTQ